MNGFTALLKCLVTPPESDLPDEAYLARQRKRLEEIHKAYKQAGNPMKIERRYSMEALAEILHDEEIRNGVDTPPPVVRIDIKLTLDKTNNELIVVFDDDEGDDD